MAFLRNTRVVVFALCLHIVIAQERIAYITKLPFNADTLLNDFENFPNYTSSECASIVTKFRGDYACTRLLFKDEFDFFDEKKWQIEQYIPKNDPEYPFVSYQKVNINPTVKVENGSLHISAKLQESLSSFSSRSLYTGSLNLFRGCTKPGEFCEKRAIGPDIIPPVVTGRITSKALAFTYGTVYVKAKMPKGDWLYPEILLQPLNKKYGSSDFNSGVIKIVSVRGNALLYTDNGTDYSNKILYAGPIMNSKCWDTLLKRQTSEDPSWGDDFHVYALSWAPDGITFRVDENIWAETVTPDSNGLQNQFPESCNIPRDLLSMGTKMAPFDDHFYLTIGLAVGGVTDFPDNSYTTDDHAKPWRNNDRKAMLKFWQDPSWYSTWTQPELVIDYIKVFVI